MLKPGLVNGRHYTSYVDEVRHLKRTGNWHAAETLLLRLVEATEEGARANRWGVAPWYYEQLAILYAKNKDLSHELEILERYERQSKAPGAGPSKKLEERLARLRAKTGRADAQQSGGTDDRARGVDRFRTPVKPQVHREPNAL
jgi:hypothetical protein